MDNICVLNAPGKANDGTNCAAGSYKASVGAGTCSACSPGYFSAPGSSACQPCTPGTYAAAGAAATCDACATAQLPAMSTCPTCAASYKALTFTAALDFSASTVATTSNAPGISTAGCSLASGTPFGLQINTDCSGGRPPLLPACLPAPWLPPALLPARRCHQASPPAAVPWP